QIIALVARLAAAGDQFCMLAPQAVPVEIVGDGQCFLPRSHAIVWDTRSAAAETAAGAGHGTIGHARLYTERQDPTDGGGPVDVPLAALAERLRQVCPHECLGMTDGVPFRRW